MGAMLIVGILIAVGFLMDVAILILAKLLPMKSESEFKDLRYESGNVPVERPKFVLPFQYVPFMLMFLSLEPIVVLTLMVSQFSPIVFISLVLILAIPTTILAFELGGVSNV